MKTLFLPTNVPPVVFWRMYQFHKKMNDMKKSSYIYGYDISNENMASWADRFTSDIKVREQAYWLFQNCDVAVMQYYMQPLFLGMQLAFQEDYKKKILIEVDDEVIDVPADSPWVKSGIKPGGILENLFREQFKQADGIVVSTDYLKKVYERYNDNVHVIPNAIDFNLWNNPVTHGTKKVRIGWAGGANHERDLEIMKEVIPVVLEKNKKAEFLFFNGVPEYLKHFGNRVRCVKKWFNITEYPKGLASLGIDIGLAPLVPNTFNMCKSNLKWLEMSALKTPIVASNVEPYKKSIVQGKSGYLCDSPRDWVDAIDNLINKESLRKRVGLEAYKQAKKEYNLDEVTKKYIKVLEKTYEQRRNKRRDKTVSEGYGLN
jgi:glycosyltransferase involved in cell wall biosynthesis